MAFQKSINKRPMYDENGAVIGYTGTLGTGISGERSDTTPMASRTKTLDADAKYGYIAKGGLITTPKEGVRPGASIANGLDVAANTAVNIATKGHFFVELELAAKRAIAEGATLEADSTDGGALSISAVAGTPGSNKKIYAKVLDAVPYTAPVAESGTPGQQGYTAPVAEKGAEQFRAANGKFYVTVNVELV